MAVESDRPPGPDHDGSGSPGGAGATVATPILVETRGALDDLVAVLKPEPLYALDTEFHRERTYWPRLALVQIAWPAGIALLDAIKVPLEALGEILDGDGLMVAHASDQDIEVLERATGTIPRRLFDTQVAAGFLGLTSPSLSSLVERFLGKRLVKGDRLTDWLKRPLSGPQMLYAADDVAYLLELAAVLSEQLEEMGRLSWAELECELLRARPHGAPQPEEAWWRMKEARSLRGSSRGVAQELAAWRERRAAEVDRPVRYVLADLALSAMTQRPPRNEADLALVRGLQGRPRGGLSVSESRDLLAAVARGLSLPESSLRLPPGESVDRRLRASVSLASAWLSQRSSELRIDPALLGTRADLESLLKKDSGSRLSSGWRAQVLGERLSDIVAGKVALVMDGDGGLLLEERSYRPIGGEGTGQV